MKSIPEFECSNRSDNHRNYVVEKYYLREKKSLSVAIVWLVVFGLFGAHRIYLKQYKEAAIVFIVAIVMGMMPPIWLVLLAVELSLISSALAKYNDELRAQLELEVHSCER